MKSRNLPPVGNQPVLWRELYAEPLYRLHRGGSIVLTTVTASLVVFGGLLVFTLIYLQLAAGTTEELAGDALEGVSQPAEPRR